MSSPSEKEIQTHSDASVPPTSQIRGVLGSYGFSVQVFEFPSFPYINIGYLGELIPGNILKQAIILQDYISGVNITWRGR